MEDIQRQLIWHGMFLLGLLIGFAESNFARRTQGSVLREAASLERLEMHLPPLRTGPDDAGKMMAACLHMIVAGNSHEEIH